MRRLGEELWIEWWSRAEACGLHVLVDTMGAMTSSSGTYDSYEDWADSASARATQLPDVRWWLTAVHGVHGQTRPQIGELYDRIYDMLAVAPCELATSHGSKEGLVSRLMGDVKVRQLRPTSVWPGAARRVTEWRRTLRKRLGFHLHPESKPSRYLLREVRWDHPDKPIREDAVRVRLP